MYRGPPPNGRLRPIPSEDQQDMKTVKMATLHIGDFKEFIEKNYINDRTEKLTVTIRLKDSAQYFYLTLIEGSKTGTQFSLNRKDNPVEIQEDDEPVVELSVKTDTATTTCCIFPTTKYERLGPYQSHVIGFPTTEDVSRLSSHFLLFRPSFGQSSPPQNVDIPINFENIQNKIGDVSFIIEPGKFSDCVIPSEIEEMWGPIPLERLPAGVDNTCLAVTHKISGYNESRKPVNVHILHSLPLCMSAVQVISSIF